MNKTTPLSLALALAATAAAPAAIILIDGSTAASAANPAGDGKHWNSLGT